MVPSKLALCFKNLRRIKEKKKKKHEDSAFGNYSVARKKLYYPFHMYLTKSVSAS